jgi:8-oxo-dGTP pyrophosphatase MutT (NUDIX family)
MIQQSSAIPYRLAGDRIEFCLITASGRKDWIFPKGIIDPGESLVETALKEAYEEAGIEGEVEGEPLGSYWYEKWDTTLHVTVMLMRVTRTEDAWPEAGVRRRRWEGVEQAGQLLRREELRGMLRRAWRRLNIESSD